MKTLKSRLTYGLIGATFFITSANAFAGSCISLYSGTATLWDYLACTGTSMITYLGIF
jgi:hypothetical protein